MSTFDWIVMAVVFGASATLLALAWVLLNRAESLLDDAQAVLDEARLERQGSES